MNKTTQDKSELRERFELLSEELLEVHRQLSEEPEPDPREALAYIPRKGDEYYRRDGGGVVGALTKYSDDPFDPRRQLCYRTRSDVMDADRYERFHRHLFALAQEAWRGKDASSIRYGLGVAILTGGSVWYVPNPGARIGGVPIAIHGAPLFPSWESTETAITILKERDAWPFGEADDE